MLLLPLRLLQRVHRRIILLCLLPNQVRSDHYRNLHRSADDLPDHDELLLDPERLRPLVLPSCAPGALHPNDHWLQLLHRFLLEGYPSFKRKTVRVLPIRNHLHRPGLHLDPVLLRLDLQERHRLFRNGRPQGERLHQAVQEVLPLRRAR